MVSFAEAGVRTIIVVVGSTIQTIFIVFMVVNYIVVFVYFRKQLRGGKEKEKDDKEKQKQENRLRYCLYAFLINTKVSIFFDFGNFFNSNSSVLLYLQSNNVCKHSAISPHPLLYFLSEETQSITKNARAIETTRAIIHISSQCTKCKETIEILKSPMMNQN
uniref:Uncharacterized protein n=1 Tax=Pristionchus pacificus TaxID=54126 RepID=A0A8R1YY58_PRIPA